MAPGYRRRLSPRGAFRGGRWDQNMLTRTRAWHVWRSDSSPRRICDRRESATVGESRSYALFPSATRACAACSRPNHALGAVHAATSGRIASAAALTANRSRASHRLAIRRSAPIARLHVACPRRRTSVGMAPGPALAQPSVARARLVLRGLGARQCRPGEHCWASQQWHPALLGEPAVAPGTRRTSLARETGG